MKILPEIFITIFLVFILFCLIFYFVYPIFLGNQKYQLGSVCIKGNCFQVEIAQSSAQRDKGLMYRNKLDKNKGMFFIFEKEGIYPFWMKNTLIPLDMIWIDNNNKIVFISQNVQPCKNFICPSIIPVVKAKYVLEVNGGICQEINLKVGDLAEIKI